MEDLFVDPMGETWHICKVYPHRGFHEGTTLKKEKVTLFYLHEKTHRFLWDQATMDDWLAFCGSPTETTLCYHRQNSQRTPLSDNFGSGPET